MPSPSSNNNASRRVLVILALLLFIVALVLVIFSSMTSMGSKKKFSFGTGSYADGYSAAREQAYRAGLVRMTVTALTGEIVGISGNSIKIKTNLFVDEKVDGVGQERTVVAEDSTKITKQVEKPAKEFIEEQQVYMEQVKDAVENGRIITPPSMYKIEEMKLSDLKPGDLIVISTDGKEDLTLVNPIKPQSIQVMQAASVPAEVTAPKS